MAFVGCFLPVFFVAAVLTPSLSSLLPQPVISLTYHNGHLLKGNLTVDIVWYGEFTAPRRAVILDFIQSLSSHGKPLGSVAAWWDITARYGDGRAAAVGLGRQVFLRVGNGVRRLDDRHLRAVAAMAGASPDSLTVVLTAEEVTVDGFCMNRCGTHGWRAGRRAFAWVGNPAKQCPGYCAWPFHQPVYGPQGPPLVSPNGDVGVDGVVINLATVMAGAVTNPFGNGYFQSGGGGGGEAVSACTGVFGEGAYPGYPGEVTVDRVTGGSFNARGVNGRKFLLPAMWDPRSSACSTQW